MCAIIQPMHYAPTQPIRKQINVSACYISVQNIRELKENVEKCYYVNCSDKKQDKVTA